MTGETIMLSYGVHHQGGIDLSPLYSYYSFYKIQGGRDL